MRYLLFTLGVAAMLAAGPVSGQPAPKSSFTEKVLLRHWSEEHKLFWESSDVGARRILDKQNGQVIRFAVATRGRVVGGLTPPRSEIVDADGVTWVVTKATPGESLHVCDVVKKPAPKAKGTKKS